MWRYLFGLVLVLSGLQIAEAGLLTFRKIAVTGDTAEGTSGGTFATVSSGFAINNTGDVAYRGTINVGGAVTTSNNEGIFSVNSAGSMTLHHRKGDSIGAHTIQQLSDVNINDSLQITALGLLSGPGITSGNDFARLGPGAGGNLTIHLQEGDTVPGSTNTFDVLAGGRVVMNNNGVTVHDRVDMDDPSGGFAGHGLWKYDPTVASPTLQTVVKAGDTAPGFPSAIFNTGDMTPKLNSSGDMVFEAPAKIGTQSPNGIWRYSHAGGSAVNVAGNGLDVPDGITGVSNDAIWSSVSDAALNDAGTVVFRGGMQVSTTQGITSDNNSGIWSQAANGDYDVLVREGVDTADGTGGLKFGELNFGFFSTAVVNGDGDVAFTSRLQGASTGTDTGIWIQDAAGVNKLIAREGATAAGVTDNAKFTDIIGQTLAFNIDQDLLFWSTLQGPGVSSSNNNNAGVWFYDGMTGMLDLVGREGDSFELAPGDVRTIDQLRINANSGGQDGVVRGLRDDGAFALWLRFTDSSHGIFMFNEPASVPEPGSFVLLLIAGVGGLAASTARRRKKKMS